MGVEVKPTELGIEVKIIDIRKIPSIEPGRFGKFDVMVVYQTPDGNVYTIKIPEESFSEEELKLAIKKDLQERTKWVGKTFRL